MIFLCVADITLAQSLFMYNKYSCSSLIKLKFKFILWYNALRPELPQAICELFPLATFFSGLDCSTYGVDVNMESEEIKNDPSTSVGLSVPRVVKFGYQDFRVSDGKWTAVCQKCKKTLTDKSGVTTSFTK